MSNPECFGLFWDGNDDACKGCQVVNECFVHFISPDGILVKSIAENPEATDEELGKIMDVAPGAITLAKKSLAPVQTETPPEEPKKNKRQPKKVEESEPKKLVPPNKVDEGDTEKEETTSKKGEGKKTSPKKRRGRKPNGWVECEACGGTGMQGDDICPVCQGEGGFVPSKEEGEEKKKTSKKSPVKTTGEQLPLPMTGEGVSKVGINGEIRVDWDKRLITVSYQF